jgi:predicted glycosyltransferase
VQSEPEHLPISTDDARLLADLKPTILVSVGGGKLGHDLLECIIEAAPLIAEALPHHIYVFAGPLMAPEKYQFFEQLAINKPNLTLRQYTPHLLAFMEKADLSISLGGYNTTMNILKTGVRSMIYPSNKDREQAIRAEKLQTLNFLDIIEASDLQPSVLTQKIIAYLHQDTQNGATRSLQLQGAQQTAAFLKTFLHPDASRSNLRTSAVVTV